VRVLLLLCCWRLTPTDLQIVQQTYIALLKTGMDLQNSAFQQIISIAMNQTANVSDGCVQQHTVAAASSCSE
jgi:hypothetical protein